MLDFMYAIHSEVEASTDTAVALRHFANYFEVPKLFDSVNKFVQKDMNKNNIHVYLTEAILYQDEKVIDATMEVGARAWQALLSNNHCLTYMELLPPSKQVQFTKLVVREAGQVLRKNKQEDAQLRRKTRADASELRRKTREDASELLRKINDEERQLRKMKVQRVYACYDESICAMSCQLPHPVNKVCPKRHEQGQHSHLPRKMLSCVRMKKR